MRARTAVVVFALGAVVGLAGDACHVASGTTRYEWDGVPELWRSAIWFPLLVGAAVFGAALAGRGANLPVRRRTPVDVLIGAAAVLALYALTATLRDQPETVSVVLCAAIAIGIFAWWDPSPRALLIAAGAAVAGPAAEAIIVAAGAASYAGDADSLAGVAPWLPCLYFAAGAVASGIWAPLDALSGRSPSQ
jgi:hypothetical protein